MSGHRYHQLSRKVSPQSDAGSQDSAESTEDAKSLCVTVDIEKCDSWNIDMAPGVWTRIINNVLGTSVLQGLGHSCADTGQIGNALKYTKSGTVSVLLVAEQEPGKQSRRDGVVTLQVTDTGIGISRDFLAKHIYTPFKQADSHSAGTGLGLSIVKRIAKDLHADLNIESELGQGTTVSLTFPTVFNQTAITESEASDELSKVATPVSDCGFHLFTLPAQMKHQHSNMANAIGQNALRLASSWLGLTPSSGLQLSFEPKDCICAIYEMDLVHLRMHEPELLSRLMSVLATRNFRLIIFGFSASAISTRSLDGYPVKPIFAQQP